MKGWRGIARSQGTTLAGLVAIALAVALGLTAFSGTSAGRTLRERAFDRLIALHGVAGGEPGVEPVVVDIGRRALEEVGPWPWPRERLAELVEAIADAGARSLAVDILLDVPDDRSPAALARQLRQAGVVFEMDPAGLADGDRRLAAALQRVPTVLGVGLSPNETGASVPSPPLIVRGTFVADGLWRSAGLVAPIPLLADAAAGFGALSLPGSSDGATRKVPLLALAGRQPVLGLALSLVRVEAGGAPILVDPAARVLRVADHAIPIGTHGLLRLIPVPREMRAARRVQAADLLAGDAVARARLAGATVLLGSTAPELGGLRTRADGSLVASVDLQADALAQINADAYPLRPEWALTAERIAVGLGALLGLLAARFMGPTMGTIAVGAGVLAWAIGASVASSVALVLVNPVLPAASLALTFGLGSLLVAARARRESRRVQSAFEQHLSPAVVRRIVSSPDTVRLKGEMRQVTALFTDIEGFSAMTAAAEPEALIALLDAYYDEMTTIVVAHEGMIAKIVGDGMNALFNVPLDLPDHAGRGLDCAEALAAAAERVRARPEARALGLGRTRIGLESGPAIVGDIGGPRKLDYTAHGSAVNAASRFEAANKNLGTSIIVGPAMAALLERDLCPLGRFVVRGFPEPLALYTVWPQGVDESAKARAHQAVDAIERPLELDRLTPDAYRALLPHGTAPRMAAEAILGRGAALEVSADAQ